MNRMNRGHFRQGSGGRQRPILGPRAKSLIGVLQWTKSPKAEDTSLKENRSLNQFSL